METATEVFQLLRACLSTSPCKSETALARVSRSFREFFEVVVASETCWDLFEPARMHSDKFGHVQKWSEAFGILWIFSTFVALVPNTGEANDEMCTPTAPKISEMCALKLANNNRLRR